MAWPGFAQTGQLWRDSTSHPISLAESTVLDSLQRAKREADHQRRRDAEKRVDLFEDDFASEVKTRLAKQFEAENWEEIVKVLDVTNNPAKRIIESISTIYHSPPTWKFGEGVDGALWKDVAKRGKLHVVLPRVNQYTNLLNECFLHVVPQGAGLGFRLVTPQNVIAWQDPDDPTRPIALAYRNAYVNSDDQTERWFYWSRNVERPERRVFDAKWRDITPFEPLNPYVDMAGSPVLPFVLYHRAWPTANLFDQTTGNDLYEVTVLIACLETWVNHLMRTDSAALKYATGLIDPKGSQIAGTQRLLTFVPGGDGAINVGQFASQADWGGLGGHISRKLANVLTNYGLSLSDFQVSGDVTSGFALRVRKEGLVEIRNRQLPVYECWDQELYAVAAAVYNFEATNSESAIPAGTKLTWPEEAGLEIVYANLATELTVQERQVQLQMDRDRMVLGLETPISLYLRDHPGSTEEGAREALDAARQTNTELGVLGGAESGAALQAKLEVKKQEMALGIRSVVDLYLESHPDQTPEQAAEAIAKNKVLNDRLVPQAVLAASAGITGGGVNSLGGGGTAAPATGAPSAAPSLAQTIQARLAARRQQAPTEEPKP